MTEAAGKITVVYLRAKLHLDLKTYMNLSEATDIHRYLMKVEEWERSHPDIKNIFKLYQLTPPRHMMGSNTQTASKRNLFCFYCGKQGPISRECRTRLVREKQQPSVNHLTNQTQTHLRQQLQHGKRNQSYVSHVTRWDISRPTVP